MKREASLGEILVASLWCFLYFLIFLLIPALFNIIFGAWMDLACTGLPEDIEKVKTDNATLMVMLGSITTVVIFTVLFAIKKPNIFKATSINKIKPRIGIDSALLGVGMLGVFQAVVLVIGKIAPSWLEAQNAHSESILNGYMWVAVIYTVIVAPICEELVFRGLMLSTLKDKIPRWASIVGIAVIFGLIHSFPIGFIYAFSLGLVLGWLYYYTSSLVPCIIVHALFNATNYLSFVPYNIGIYVVMALAIPFIAYSVFDIVKTSRRQI
ncbi:MAG: CPBP family intramembrane metalloprotease [Ruminococcaceae bacterium]|nr:CPBP family intramembrane metalloprotease [Oscillospiraceae bacterium]